VSAERAQDLPAELLCELAELRASERRLRDLLQRLPCVVYVSSAEPTSRLLYISERVRDMFGLELRTDQEPPTLWRDRLHPEDRERTDAAWLSVLRGDAPTFLIEYRLRHGDDRRYVWVADHGTLVRDAAGTVQRVDGILMDISVQKQAEARIHSLLQDLGASKEKLEREVEDRTRALRASEQRYRQVVESLSEGIGLTAVDGSLRFCNQRLAEMVELPQAELIGRPLASFVAPEQAGDLARALARHLGERAQLEVTLVSASGRRIATLISGAPISGPEDELRGVLVVVTDISRLRRAEELIWRQNQELVRANRLKDEFLANMSHELRTPLTSILGFAELLQDESIAAEARRHHLEVIQAQGQHLMSLLNDLLDLSRISAGQARLRRRRIAVVPLVEEVAAGLRLQALRKGLQLQLRADDPMLVLEADPERLRRIARNLIDNAIKFTPSGGRVEVSVAASADQVELAVRDTGVGIAAELHEVIFERFHQLDGSLTREHGGIGLGLHLVRAWVREHGGQVTVESAPGAGSTFRVRLPAHAPAEGSVGPGPERREGEDSRA
jgi:PAS domain S-box-containing protein